ncbi:MAG: chemotaxis protein CheW [Sedimentibacter sp.]|uniref:chemotaxis protein CheW n=1 Tax=Sedimentibacter sp. TaxID=1960295 RepID=UPI002980E2D5|nr:chemotaxis protein CheW [Sedimentibacter sp.]MDW5300105.1 chemotaxis protein CheW [Sedimentibacter sp.]
MYNEDVMEQLEEIEFPWLVFKIKDNLYTVNSRIITSIVMLSENVTKIPNVPNYILGLIHLRGNVIPLVDLRLLFNMKSCKEECDENEFSKNQKEMVIVFEEDNSFMGILVDEVLSVENITPFEETEEIKKMCKDGYVKGVAKGHKNNDVLLILDEEKIMNMA